MAALATGAKAPQFELPLLGGGKFSLYDSLANGSIALVFVKVSCPVCQYALPYYERLYRKMSGRGVSFLAVSQDGAVSTAAFVKEYGVSFPVALDSPDYKVSNAYGLTNVPTFFFVGVDAEIGHVIVGWSKQEVENVYGPYTDSDNAQTPLFPAVENVADFKAG